MSSTHTNPQPVISFLYIEDSNPVLVFGTASDARTFAQSYHGAEIYGVPTDVFVPKPHGLESVRAAKNGELAYVFHHAAQAEHWAKKLGGAGFMVQDSTSDHPRTVFVGQKRT